MEGHVRDPEADPLQEAAHLAVGVFPDVAEVAGRVDEVELVVEDGGVEALKGTWQMVSGTRPGNVAIPEDEVKQFTMVIDDSTLTHRKDGKDYGGPRSYTIDPAKTPKEIDLEYKEGAAAGARRLGIYELDGDTLKISLGSPDRRPTGFDPKSRWGMGVYKRLAR